MIPPSRVQIKRKATDDPVEILRVHDEIAQGANSGRYVFKRQRKFAAATGAARSSQPTVDASPKQPVIQVSQPGDHLRAHIIAAPQIPSTGTQRISTNASIASRPIAEPRRFHMQRVQQLHATTQPAGIQKPVKSSSIAVFHERKNVTPQAAAALQSVVTDTTQPQPAAPVPAQITQTQGHLRQQPSITKIRLQPVSAVKPRKNSPAPPRASRLVSGTPLAWNASAEEKQAHTLAQIGMTMAAADEASKPATPRKVQSHKDAEGHTRWSPRAGAARGARHPEVAAAREEAVISSAETVSHPANTTTESGHLSTDKDDSAMEVDDSEYITETYIRVPVEQLSIAPSPQSIGLLVLDSQPDIDDFYDSDEESDSDIYDEEEDENAENHPRTEYPDEEVQSDDEYGRNPYQYRNGNASDNEEYDSEDARFSDEEREGRKEPWLRRPWGEAYGGKGRSRGFA